MPQLFVAYTCMTRVSPFENGSNEMRMSFACKRCATPWFKIDGTPLFSICQDFLDQCQCWSMPIKIMALIRDASQCRSLPTNSIHCRSMPDQGIRKTLFCIDRHWSYLIVIDPHWSALISIGINVIILIGIDRHWALIEGVLICLHSLDQCPVPINANQNSEIWSWSIILNAFTGHVIPYAIALVRLVLIYKAMAFTYKAMEFA